MVMITCGGQWHHLRVPEKKLEQEESKKAKAVGALLKAKDKINDAISVLSVATQSGILGSNNFNITDALVSLQIAKTFTEKELSYLWGNKTSEQKENDPSSVLGHP